MMYDIFEAHAQRDATDTHTDRTAYIVKQLMALLATGTSAFMNIEAWRKNESIDSFDRLTKGAMITVEGYFKPEEWQDGEGVKHNRVVLVANKFYETPDKEETPAPEKKTTKKAK